MKVVILAGGYGTRISEESHLLPKPMIEIGGKPILWHILRYYSAFGFNEFVVCCGYRGYVIKEYFANYALHRSDLTFDFADGGKMTVHANVSEPWKVTLVDTGADVQTGGRIKRIAPYVGNERFMLTYGDGVSDVDLKALLAQHKGSGHIVTLTAIQPGGRFGVLDIEGDTVTAFREKAVEEGGWVNGGFMVAEPELFHYIDDDRTVLERAPLERLSAERRLGVYKHSGYWQCMDTQRDKAALEAAWASGSARWKLWKDGKMRTFQEEFSEIEAEANSKITKVFSALKLRLGDRPFVLYGAGRLGSIFLEICRKLGIEVARFCDRSVTGKYEGIEVIDPQTLKSQFPNAFVVVCSWMYNDEICGILRLLDFPPERVIPCPVDSPFFDISRRFVHRDGYEWAYDFFEDERSKRFVLDRLRFVLCGRPLAPHIGKDEKMRTFQEEFSEIEAEIKNSKIMKVFSALKPRLEDRPLVLYDAGRLAEVFLDICHELGIEVAGVCASSVTGEYEGIKIIDSQTLKSRFPNAFVVVCSWKYNDDICNILRRLDFPAERIIPCPIDYPCFDSLRRFSTRHLDGYAWAYDFFEDEVSKRLVLDRLRLVLCDWPLVPNTRSACYYEEDFITLTSAEVFVDGGAYTGDTAEEFIGRLQSAGGGGAGLPCPCLRA